MQVARFWRTKQQRYRLQGVMNEKNEAQMDKKVVRPVVKTVNYAETELVTVNRSK